jgi:HAD superfamily hydrolase (TIGR01509 family)
MKLTPAAILFDMDGVLIDSLESWWMSLNSALEAFHHSPISKEEFIEVYWGHDLKDNLKKMKLNPEIGTFCNINYRNHVHAIQIYDDTYKTLQKLHAYKKAIITNTPKDCTQQILKRFAIAQYFNVIVTSDDVPRSKPSPAIVFKACTLLKVNPEKTVLIGDTTSDVKAGKAAGCRVVGINIAADHTITRLSELIHLLT